MKEVYINIKNENDKISDLFKDKDLVSIDDLLGKIEDLLWEKEELERQIKDLEQDIEDNYRPITIAEQVL